MENKTVPDESIVGIVSKTYTIHNQNICRSLICYISEASLFIVRPMNLFSIENMPGMGVGQN